MMEDEWCGLKMWSIYSGHFTVEFMEHLWSLCIAVSILQCGLGRFCILLAPHKVNMLYNNAKLHSISCATHIFLDSLPQ